MAKLTPSQRMAVAYIIMRQKMPYLQTLLNTLVCVETPGLNTLGVTDRLVLMWDPAFVERVTNNELAAVLLHEVMHVMQKHDKRFKRYVFGREDVTLEELRKDKDFHSKMKIWNIAGDCEINDDIRETDMTLPKDCCYPETFEMKPGKLAEEYYQELQKQFQQQKQQNANGGNCDGSCQDSGDESGDGDSDSDGNCDGHGNGDCGHDHKKDCGGNGRGKCQKKPDPNEVGGSPGNGGCGSCSGNPLQSEQNLDASEGRNQGEIERTLKQTAEEINDAREKNQGSVPGGLARWAESFVKPPKVRWEDKLTRAVRGAVNYVRGRMDYDRKRLSRAQWGLGVGPGKPILPGMCSPVPNVWFAIDTSGSMSQSDLQRSVAESAGVLKALSSPVTFISCDCTIASVSQAHSWQDITKKLVGGGGTSFCPVFDEIEKAKVKPDILIFATDGCGDAPANPPPRTKVIWILVGQYRQKPYKRGGNGPVDYGEFIEIDD